MIAVDRYKGVIRYERPKASALATNEKDKIIFLGRYDKYSEYYEIANKYSKLDYIHYDSGNQFNSKSHFFSYLN